MSTVGFYERLARFAADLDRCLGTDYDR